MELPVIVERITFRGEKGFAILAANLDPYSTKYTPEMEELMKDCINKKYDTFTISIGMLDSKDELKGGQYIFIGEIKDDKKFGKQFKADFYYQDIPSTKEGLKTFLMTLPNIKESRSELIIEKFGVEGAIHILDNDIGRLTEISGINDRRIPAIKKSWDEKKYLRDLYSWMVEKEIPVSIADKSYNLWGKEALKIIKENPYRLVEIRGIGFLTADKIAHKVDKNISTEFRVTACIKYILTENVFNNSNLCIPYPILKKNLIAILSECDDTLCKKVDSSVYLAVIPVVLKANLDTFTLVKNIKDGAIYIYLKSIWEKEKYIANAIYERKEFNHASKDRVLEMMEKIISENS